LVHVASVPWASLRSVLTMVRFFSRGLSHLDRDFHSLKRVGRAFPSARKRHGLVLFARDGYRDMLGAGLLVVRGIEAPPAGARNVNIRPSVRGTMLAVGQPLTNRAPNPQWRAASIMKTA